jgi:hypothetical protein
MDDFEKDQTYQEGSKKATESISKIRQESLTFLAQPYWLMCLKLFV